MSICDVKGCGDNTNIWKISNENTNPPFFKEFCLCDYDLHLDKRYEMVHKALVKGRFNNQSGDKISYDSWNLEKVITTWKQNEHHLKTCSVCNTSEKIWIIVKPVQAEESDPSEVEGEENVENETDFLCDQHLVRFWRDLKIRSYNDDVGSSTLESTWIEKKNTCPTPPKKAKKAGVVEDF